jgi:hypothetical protein
MSPRRFASALLTLVTALAVLPRSADACWDGISVSSSKVQLGIESTAAWTPEQARYWATWIARIDALVPEGKSLSVMHGFVQICDDAGGECEGVEASWDDSQPFTLFELTADLFEAKRATIHAARRTERAPLTVQIAASHDLIAAEKLAMRINESELPLAGFLDVGGFPSSNAVAHVVEPVYYDGVYQVVVGAFLERSDADGALQVLASELDMHGFVRTLDQWSVGYEGC